MLAFIIIGSLMVLATGSDECCDHTSCNLNLMKYYDELGCQPVQATGECCPSEYDCTDVLDNQDPNTCYVRGRSYLPGASVPVEELGEPCVAQCRCVKTSSGARLNCVYKECPENFFGNTPGCTNLYSHGQCCSIGQYCGNDTNAVGQGVFTCEYGGHSYVAGQKFWPEDEPCMSCICQEGFDGTLTEPWCKEVSCGFESHHFSRVRDGCAPVYFGKSRCCPIGWRCPQSSDYVVPSSAIAAAEDGPECEFGKLRLQLSQTLNSEKSCVECKCSLPPHVSCVQSGYC